MAEEMAAPASVVKASYWFPDGEGKDPAISARTIPAELFTHLFCAYADVDADTHKVVISPPHEFIFSTFTNIVKCRNEQVKTLLSVGGRNGNNYAFASMASKHQSRKMFIDSCISIARSNGFHGLDLAWEYPNNETEMTNFGDLVGELRYAVDAEHRRSSKPTLLLTAAVYYSSVYKTCTYPVRVMKDNLDWVNIIAYEFYGSSTTIGPPAGLYSPYYPEGPCGDSGLNQWIKAGLPEMKAVFGFPYVGWGWTFDNDKDQSDDVAATTGVAESPTGSINYNQIRELPGRRFYDSKVVGDYCISPTTLIGYDDIQSVVTKVRYTKYNGLLGYFAWNVGADDECHLSLAAWKAWSV